MSDSDVAARRWCVLPIALVAAVVAACSGSTSDAGSAGTPEGTVVLTVLAFTSSAPGWNASIPAFHETEAGSKVKVQATYGPSAELSRSLLDGGPGDVVYLADQPNIDRLVEQEKISADWNSGPYAGRPFGSVATLVVREGNPLNIQNWSDLLRPGVEVVAANPVLSGSGKWGLMAAYAAASDGGQNPDAGIKYLNKLILEHVLAGPSTVPEAIDLFLSGTGDVLIAPENSAIDTERQSTGMQRILPPQTLRIDNQAAVVETSAYTEEAGLVVDYLYTREAQRLWAKAGFRPMLQEVAEEFAADFPTPQTLWTIDDLGGWSIVEPRFYDPQNGIITKIFKQATQ